MTNEEREKKLADAKKKYGKQFITEIMVKKKNIKPPILGKSKFQFQR